MLAGHRKARVPNRRLKPRVEKPRGKAPKRRRNRQRLRRLRHPVAHPRPQSFWPILNHGELPVLFCFIFFYIAIHGGGRLSLDSLLSHRRAKALPPPPAAEPFPS